MTSRNGFGHRRWAGITAGALVVLLVGCGSQANKVDVKRTTPPSPRKVVLASVLATAAAKTARVSMTMTMTGLGEETEAVEVVVDGVTEFETGNSSMKMQFGGLGSEDEIGGMETRVVDGVAYLQMPAALGGMFGEGKWLKMPDLGSADSAMPGLGQSDPSKFLAYLETVSNGVKKVGTDLIRGIETTHYAATLDLGKAVNRADMPASLRDELRELFNGDSFSAIPADVWVDEDGIARRIRLQLDLGDLIEDLPGVSEDAPAMTMTMSMDLYDFGVPVHVVAPPASDVTEFPSFGPSGPSGADFGFGDDNPKGA